MEKTQRINIDHQTVTPVGTVTDVSRIKSLHPTLKKCKCGWIGTRSKLYKHFAEHKGMEKFFTHHGEVPLNVDEGETWQNEKWLEGTPRGYND